jgi:hypothetical protein
VASKGGRKLADPIEGTRQVNVMESGLTHCADSQGGGRQGTAVMRFGAPTDPLDKSPGVSSGYVGKTPNLDKKFIRKEQR